MSNNKDLAASVNAFMLANAPALTEATPMAYDMLKAIARYLVFKVKTTKEHALYVMNKKYQHLYASGVVEVIIDEAIGDEQSERIGAAKRRRLAKLAASSAQPRLLAV